MPRRRKVSESSEEEEEVGEILIVDESGEVLHRLNADLMSPIIAALVHEVVKSDSNNRAHGIKMGSGKVHMLPVGKNATKKILVDYVSKQMGRGKKKKLIAPTPASPTAEPIKVRPETSFRIIDKEPEIGTTGTAPSQEGKGKKRGVPSPLF